MAFVTLGFGLVLFFVWCMAIILKAFGASDISWWVLLSPVAFVVAIPVFGAIGIFLFVYLLGTIAQV